MNEKKTTAAELRDLFTEIAKALNDYDGEILLVHDYLEEEGEEGEGEPVYCRKQAKWVNLRVLFNLQSIVTVEGEPSELMREALLALCNMNIDVLSASYYKGVLSACVEKNTPNTLIDAINSLPRFCGFLGAHLYKED